MKLSPAAYKIHADFQSSTGENCNAAKTWIIVLYFPHLYSTFASVLSMLRWVRLLVSESTAGTAFGGGEGDKKALYKSVL